MSSSTADIVTDVAHLDESSHKRKRDVQDNGDRDQKKVHVEDSRIRIEDLHLDVGKIYTLCRTRKAPLSPRDPAGYLPSRVKLIPRPCLSCSSTC